MNRVLAITHKLQTRRSWALEHAPLLGILGIGLALRLVGISYGLPEVYTTFESSVIGQALNLVKAGSLIPDSYEYLPFVKYLHAGLFGAWFGFLRVAGMVPSVEAFEQLYFLNQEGFYLLSRLVTAVFGTLTVWLTYLFGKKAFGRAAGLIAAALVAANTIHVIDSHFGLTDVPMTAMAALTLVLLLKAIESPGMSPRIWGLAGAAMALSVSFKQTGGVLLLPFIVALVIKWALASDRALGGGRFFQAAVAGLGAFILLGVVLNLGAAMDGARFLQYQLERLSMGGYVSSVKYQTTIPGWKFYLGTAMWEGFGPVGLAVGALGVLLALVIRSWADLILMALILPYSLLICWAAFHQTRYLNLLIPPLALLIGKTISVAWDRLKPLGRSFQVTFTIVLMVGLLGWPLHRSVAVDYRLTQPDTRTLAKEWLMANVKAEEPVIIFSVRPQFAPILLPGREAAIIQSRFRPSGKLNWLLALPNGGYPPESRHVIYVTRSEEYAALSNTGFPFVVTVEASGQSTFFRIMNPDHIRSIQFHEFFRHDPRIQNLLMTNYREVERFSPSDRNLGFKITIYRMNPSKTP